ncbi:DNA topoisomerase [Achlya hypogyna]|uniref:DNA topoisomerase I n=1 Tax=Achlya hypogyna TaxID=1202772 RepID=A0A1V9Y5I6_ACHHY|nr:DNA topoisomerase [Achlya hypogyna]
MASSDSDLEPLRKKVKTTKKAAASDDSDFDETPLASLKPKKAKVAPKKALKKEGKKEVKKEVKKSKTMAKAKDTKKKSSVKVKAETGSVRKLKVQSKSERLDMAIKAYRWWNAEELPEDIQWRTLEHNGVMFPPAYEPHGVPLYYDGQPVQLTPAQEEIASFYAAMPLDGPQLGNPKTSEMFTKNFFADFKESLGKGHVVKTMAKCNFDKIRQHLDEQKERKKERTKEEKAPEKAKREVEQFNYGFAIVDGHLEKVGNFRIEPPNLFRGRGEHPKTGTLKKAVMPEEVTINCGIEDRVPECPMPGHAWKEVIHRDTVSWLAYWNENVMGGIKYVWLAASSSFKGKADMEKYEKARRLKKFIGKIRKDYTEGLKAKDMFTRQRSTAMWVIDVLALRVGNEKGEDEADTVGCCSLRVEHASFSDDNCELTLSFLGKDSMPYNNTIRLSEYGAVGELVYRNVKSFCAKKQKQQDIFDELSVTELNKHLSSLMPGLSAKVFRTFNASVTLEKELPATLSGDDVAVKVVAYNDANRKVAILCNHQRTVPKNHDVAVEKMMATLEQLKEQLVELEEMKGLVKKNKTKQIQIKTEEPDDDADAKKAQAHRFAKVPTADQVDKKIDSWTKKIKALDLRLRDKNDNKEVALGTSKINYMDPRITVAWAKRNEVPIAGVFPRALREKFVWSMDVDPDWTF